MLALHDSKAVCKYVVTYSWGKPDAFERHAGVRQVKATVSNGHMHVHHTKFVHDDETSRVHFPVRF